MDAATVHIYLGYVSSFLGILGIILIWRIRLDDEGPITVFEL